MNRILRCDDCPIDTVCLVDYGDGEFVECEYGSCGECFEEDVKLKFENGRWYVRILIPGYRKDPLCEKQLKLFPV